MKIYKVTYHRNTISSEGFSFHSSLKEAKQKFREFEKEYPDDVNTDISGVRVVEFSSTLKSVIDLLNRHASHPDNG